VGKPWLASSGDRLGPGGASGFVDGAGNLEVAYHYWNAPYTNYPAYPQCQQNNTCTTQGQRRMALLMVTDLNHIGSPVAVPTPPPTPPVTQPPVSSAAASGPRPVPRPGQTGSATTAAPTASAPPAPTTSTPDTTAPPDDTTTSSSLPSGREQFAAGSARPGTTGGAPIAALAAGVLALGAGAAGVGLLAKARGTADR
jgi:hypothetical protein